jgi:hypothetical protein
MVILLQIYHVQKHNIKEKLKMENQEYHEKQFNGTFIPAELHEYIENKTINPREFLLLTIVASLINIKKEDCFASNRYLAEKIGCKETQVKLMVSHLKEIGLLIQTGFDGRKRYLATFWSHHIIKPIPKTNSRKTVWQTVGKPSGRHTENRLEIYKEEIDPVYNSPLSNDKEELHSPCLATDESVSGDNLKKLEYKTNPVWKQYANKLKEAIGTVRKLPITSNISKWELPLFKIHDLDKFPIDRIERVLNWYCKELQKGDLIRDNSNFIPIAYSGAAFREKFERIEAAMLRQKSKQGKVNKRQYYIENGIKYVWDEKLGKAVPVED